MSPAIDERVVQMEFDNSRFEKNVSTSISTLDRLKSALNLDGGTKGLNAVEQYANRLDLSGIGVAVESISNRFSAMGIIGMQVLQNIADQAFHTGERLVKSLSIDQIMSGWNKYAEKTTSVQTIMAATNETWKTSADNLGFAGSQMEFVNSQMDKLNWFTDETSYNFTDMVNNIGKFTSNQIPLEQAVTAMQGIANWAAISGQNASSASQAMYNLAQAIGVGSVKLMDWRSIENANMGTAEFKQKVLDVAAANGMLEKSVDKAGQAIFKTKSGMEVSVQNFSQTLSEGWFDKDTLIGVLDQYGSFTDELYNFSEASGLTATEILSLIDAEKEGSITQEQYQDIMKESGMTLDEVKAALASLGSEENEFGRKTFMAGQEAKTFQDAIDATKDAASTKWMNIFENIFGDYEKARKIWTGFAEFLYNTLVAPLEKLEGLSEILGELNAVSRIARGFSYIFSFLKGDGVDTYGVFDSIKRGFDIVFPPVENLKLSISRVLTAFTRWGKSIQLTKTQALQLASAGAGLAKVLQFVVNSISNIWKATEPLRTALSGLVSSIVNLFIRIGQAANGMDTTGVKAELLGSICEKLAAFIEKVSEAIDNISIDDLKSKFSILGSIFKGISSVFSWLGNQIKNFSFGETFGAAIDWIKEKFQGLKDFLSGFDLSKAFKGAAGAGIGTILSVGLVKFLSNLTSPLEAFDGIADKVSGVFDSLKGAIKSFQTEVAADMIQKIATAILELSVALLILGFVNYDNAITGMMAIGVALAALFMNLELLNKINGKSMAKLGGTLILLASAMLIFAVSLAVLAGAVALFALVAKMNTVWKGLAVMAASLAIAVGALALLNKMSPMMIAGAAAILILAAALIVLAGAITAFALIAKMGAAVWKGFGLMAASLGVLIIALLALSHLGPMMIVGAAAILVLSGALLVLSGALAAFALIAGKGKGDAWIGLGLLAAALLVLVAALLVLAPAALGALGAAAALLVVSAACLVLAVAIGVVGLALPLLGAGLLALAAGVGAGLTALGDGIAGFGAGVGSLIESVMSAIALGVEALIASIGKGIADGINAISLSITNFSDGLSNVGTGITDFGNGVRSLEGIAWTATALGIAELAGALKKLNVGNLAGGFAEATQAVTEACTTMIASIQALFDQFASAMSTTGSTAVTKFASGIRSRASAARSAGSSVGASATSGLSSGASGSYTVGSNYGQGFINGILDKVSAAYNAGYSLGKAAEQGNKDGGGVASPSKVMYKVGSYYSQGFVNGIESLENQAYNAGESLGSAAIDPVASAISNLAALMETDAEFSPTITPVLDISKVKEGMNSLAQYKSTLDVDGAVSPNYSRAVQNGSISNTASNVNSFADMTSQAMEGNATELIRIGNRILDYLGNGQDLYLDDGVLAGRINRRLGRL